MADTIRSLAELNALLGDNTTGSISPQDIRDLMISQMVHGELLSDAKSPAALSSGWNVIGLDVAGVISRGLTLDTASHRITDVPVSLKAVITVEMMFKGIAGQSYEFTVWKNSQTTPEEIARMHRTFYVVNAAQTIHGCWSAAVQLAAADTLEIGVRSGTNSFELLAAVLRVQRIGVE